MYFWKAKKWLDWDRAVDAPAGLDSMFDSMMGKEPEDGGTGDVDDTGFNNDNLGGSDEAIGAGIQGDEDNSDEGLEDDSSDPDLDGMDDGSDDPTDSPDDSTNKKLLDIIENLSSGQKKELLEQENSVVDITPVDVFEGEEFKEVVEALDFDSDETTVFKSFLSKLLAENTKQVLAQTDVNTPMLVNDVINRQTVMKKTREDFYTSHPALSEVKEFVGNVAKAVAKEKGDKATMDDVLQETAKRSYKALGIDPGKVKKEASSKKKPAFSSSSNARKEVKKPSTLDKQFDRMLALDE